MPLYLVHLLPLAFQQELAPLVASALFLMIPIMAIWTKHQQKMAMIQRDARQAGQLTDTEARILQELASLRELVAQQALIVDDLASAQRALSANESADAVRQRIHL
jgi:hypothetical protein